MKALFDTNILIDYLLGVQEAQIELDKYKQKKISIITKMELLVGAENNNETLIRDFFNHFEIIPIDDEISEKAVIIRREKKLKLPDAIIWASAEHHDVLLVTRNTKDFPKENPRIRIPYSI